MSRLFAPEEQNVQMTKHFQLVRHKWKKPIVGHYKAFCNFVHPSFLSANASTVVLMHFLACGEQCERRVFFPEFRQLPMEMLTHFVFDHNEIRVRPRTRQDTFVMKMELH